MSTPVTPEQREAARLVVQMDRDLGRRTSKQVLAVATSSTAGRRLTEDRSRED